MPYHMVHIIWPIFGITKAEKADFSIVLLKNCGIIFFDSLIYVEKISWDYSETYSTLLFAIMTSESHELLTVILLYNLYAILIILSELENTFQIHFWHSQGLIRMHKRTCICWTRLWCIRFWMHYIDIVKYQKVPRAYKRDDINVQSQKQVL